MEAFEIGIFIFWGFRSIFGIFQLFNLPLTGIFEKYHLIGFIYAITMIYIIIKAIPRVKKLVWVMSFLLLLAFMVSSLNFNDYKYIKQIISGDLIIETIPLVAILSLEDDADKMLKCIRFSSYFVLMKSLIVPTTQVYKSGQYSYMYLAYSSIVPWAVICYYALNNKGILDIFFTIAGGINFFLFGPRGVILCMVGFIFVCICIIYKSKKKYIILSGAAFIFIFIMSNLTDIVNWFTIKINGYSLQSRTLTALLGNNITDSSGRNSIYHNIIEAIKRNPFGYGIGSDRVINGGTGNYAHNMFLELITDFGVPFGCAICIGIIAMYIYMLYSCDDVCYKILFCAFAVPGLIMLMLSGSVYENYEILVAFVIFSNYICKKEDVVNYQRLKGD